MDLKKAKDGKFFILINKVKLEGAEWTKTEIWKLIDLSILSLICFSIELQQYTLVKILSSKQELERKNNNGSLMKFLRQLNQLLSKTYLWILEEETYMPTRQILNGTNFSSMSMVASYVKTTWVENRIMSLKFPQVEQILKTDKYQEQQRTTINGSNGKSCMLMKLNLNQHLVIQRSSVFGSTDHSTFNHI